LPPGAAQRSITRLEPARPDFGLLLDRKVERRLEQMGKGDAPGALLAIGFRPALPEPVRAIEAGGILRLEQPRAIAGGPAEHGIREPAREALAAARQRHRLGDRGVRRRAQKQELDRAQPEQVADPERLGRRPQEGLEDGIDLTEPAERGRDQQAGMRAVARGEQVELRMAGERLVKRAVLTEHPIEHVEREPAGADRGDARLPLHAQARGAQAAG
jgi:hypothetical protein